MPPPPINLLVALAIGLLIGIERERAQQEQGTTFTAGLRTFSVAALAGAAAVLAGGAWLLGATAVLAAGFAALGYLRTAPKLGPGMTTEFTLVLTVLLGGLAIGQPAAAGAIGVVTTVLLASRERLHRFAGSVLTDEEMRSALILAAAVVVVLPFLPDRPMGSFGALNPWKIWRLVVLVLGIGAAGYLATRLLGARFGLPVSGLASGFVSSAATLGAMGVKARAAPALLSAAVAGAVLSTVATVAQMAVVLGATAPAALGALAWPLAAAGLAAVAYGAVFTLAALRAPADGAEARPGDPFSLKAALAFAALLTLVMLGSAAAQAGFGEAGIVVAAALAGFADTHAPAISVAALVGDGRMTPQAGLWPILAAFTTNTVTKVAIAATAGGGAFAARVIPGVLLVAAAAWAGALAPLLLG